MSSATEMASVRDLSAPAETASAYEEDPLVTDVTDDSGGWGDVDPALLASIIEDCFGPSTAAADGSHGNVNIALPPVVMVEGAASAAAATEAQRRDEEALAAAFEAAFESIAAPFLVAPTDGSGGAPSSSSTHHSSSSSAAASPADNIAALHRGLTDCNARLLEMEGALRDFNTRIIAVCEEIDIIRAEAMGTRAARDGKRALQRHITMLLDLVVIPPDIIHLVLMAPEQHQQYGGAAGAGGSGAGGAGGPLAAGGAAEELSQQFLLAIRRLHTLIRRRIACQDLVIRRPPASKAAAPSSDNNNNINTSNNNNADSDKNSTNAAPLSSAEAAIIIDLFKCRAFREMVATTEDLLIFVCMRIRAFLAPKISALENPRANPVASQEHVLRGYRQLVRFLQDAASYLRMTLALRPTAIDADADPFATAPNNGGGGDVPSAEGAAMVQHRPFIPFRVVKALYEDLKQQYLTVMSRVYSARIGRYLVALSEVEVGHQKEEPVAASVATSVVGGLASLFWGGGAASSPTPSTSAPHSSAMSGGLEPTASDHAAARRDMTRPPLLGDRCTVGPYTAGSASGGGGGGGGGSASAAAAAAASAIMAGRSAEVTEDLRCFSLGVRGNMFRGDGERGLLSPAAAASPIPPPGSAVASPPAAAEGMSSPIVGTSQRQQLLTDPHCDAGVFRTPTIPHIARMRRQFHTYEETFRSLIHILSDTVSHEYLFQLDFFGADSWRLCGDIFRKTLQAVIDHISDKIILNAPRADLLQQQHHNNNAAMGGAADRAAASAAAAAAAAEAINSAAYSPFISGNKDVCGLLILLRMTLIFRTQMVAVRRLHVLEPFHHSLLALLRPAIHSALEDHTRSLRTTASLAADKIAASCGGGSSHHHQQHSLLVVPPPFGAIAAVHPIALRYAAFSTMLMLLTDLSFVPHYRHLRRAETIARAGGGGGGGSGGFLPEEEDEEEAEFGSWLAALRANMSVQRIEACRLLALHGRQYETACNGLLRRRLGEECAAAAGSGNGNGSRPRPRYAVAVPSADEERLWLAAVAPLANSLHHIVFSWEQSLDPRAAAQRCGMGPAPPQPPNSSSSSSGVPMMTAAVGPTLSHPLPPPPPYDLAVSLPTGLRHEWERSAAPALSATPLPSTAATPNVARGRGAAAAPFPPASGDGVDATMCLAAGAFRLSPAERQMVFSLRRSPDYAAMVELLDESTLRLAKTLVRLAFPSLAPLSLLTVAFGEEGLALADDLLLLSAQLMVDDDDLAAVDANAEEEAAAGGSSGADAEAVGHRLRFGSEARSESAAAAAEGDGPSDGGFGSAEEPREERIGRLVSFASVVFARSDHLGRTWEDGARSLRRLLSASVLQPSLMNAVLTAATAMAVEACGLLAGQLAAAAHIAGRLRARRERMGDAAFEYVIVPNTDAAWLFEEAAQQAEIVRRSVSGAQMGVLLQGTHQRVV